MLTVGDPLPALTLQGPGDRTVELSSLFAGAPLAAIFLRHFG